MSKLVGKSFDSLNSGVIDADGFWTVQVVLKETEYFDDGTATTETIERKVIDKDFQTAHEGALRSALTSLREEVYDKGLKSLIEARHLARRLAKEEATHDIATANQDTPTE